MGVWLGPMGSNKVSFITEDDYEYTNKSTASVYFNDVQGVNWEIVLKKGGILKFKKNPGAIDIFMVGGGSSGTKGKATSQEVIGGNGGQGGECRTFNLESSSISRNKSYEIEIGDGGAAGDKTTKPNSGGSTTFKINNTTTLIVLGGGMTDCPGAAGGTGAKYGSGREYSTDGNPGTFAFEEENASIYSPSTRYGGSGGGGNTRFWGNGGYAPTGKNAGYDVAVGGDSFGGNGGYAAPNVKEDSQTGRDAEQPNTGSGGGGGAGDWHHDSQYNYEYDDSKNGGAGAAGIIIIRNHRSS